MAAPFHPTSFAKATAVRAVRTAAQSALAAIGGTLAFHEVEWALVASIAGLSAVASVLTSLATGLPETEEH